MRCSMRRRSARLLAAARAPAAAQVRTVDPNRAIDARSRAGARRGARPHPRRPATPPRRRPRPQPADGTLPGGASPASDDSHPVARRDRRRQRRDLPAERRDRRRRGRVRRGAEGLAKIVEKILKDQGEPNAYIAGREAGGAFAVGLRYGSGVMHHKVEGDRPVYWTGPSLGFDFGGNGAKSFILVYNLYDSQELFHRFPAAEGAAYLIGGFTASYLRRKDMVLIPIRLGVGWRLGANVGYLNFTEKSRWLPF